MPYPFLLSYARRDATIGGDPTQPDPNFEAFLRRLNQRVLQITAGYGFVDRTDLQPGQEWPDELAEALRIAQTMVCLYSPSYFQSDYCGKEMHVFLERRGNYIRAYAGKKPANIIPVLWQPVPWRIPKTLPDIQYKDANLDPNTTGVWDLGDRGQIQELNRVADQIAFRVRDAADLTPLPALPARPRLAGVRSAFLPPPLPLPEFDSPGARAGPNAVTFVYPASTRWNAWPWAPPEEQAVLFLAAAVAKGRELECTQLTFDVADANLAERLVALRRNNNIVVLLLDASSLHGDDLRIRIRDYDRHDHSSFAAVIVVNESQAAEVRARITEALPCFTRRPAPHFQIIETPTGFNTATRESFSKAVADAVEQLRIAVVNDPYAPNAIGDRSGFQSMPVIEGPGQRT
jgi:hypothetical protein